LRQGRRDARRRGSLRRNKVLNMARKFAFKGLAMEQVKELTIEEFIKLVPSHARRTMRRMGVQVKKFIEKFRKHKKSGKPMKTHYRQMIVLPEMVGFKMLVYDGKQFKDLMILPEMLGKRLGEFAITTKLVKHGGPGVGATRGSKTVELK